MERPDFLNCTTDKEWEEWWKIEQKFSNSSANSLKHFCDDCTPEFFAYNVERGLCFQARIQDGEITIEEIKASLDV